MDFSADVGNVDCRETAVTGAVKIEVDTGDITFDGSAAGVDAETDVGNVKLLLPGPAENWAAQLQTDVGSVTVDGLDQGRQYQSRGGQYPLDAETDVGNVRLTLPGPAESWAAELQTDVGSVTVDGLDQGRQYQSRGGQYPLDAETDTGDVEVEFK